MTTSYDADFYTWTQVQAQALRAKDWQALDLGNLAEEIESLGKRDRRGVESYLEVVAKHLLKRVYQPQERARRGRSWRTSVGKARRGMERLIEDSPSLRDVPASRLVSIYRRAPWCRGRDRALPSGISRHLPLVPGAAPG